MNIDEKIKSIKEELIKKLKDIKDMKSLNEIRVEYLGKKGVVTELSTLMKDLDNDQKKEFGKNLNDLRKTVESNLESLKVKIEEEELNKKLESESIDVTLPGNKLHVGSVHPINKIIEEVEELFISMGYDVAEGPEVENDLYNFELLNLPAGHPARDAQDSFYINEEMLLRSQTSPVQIRTMLANKEKTPIRIICPGKVYRKDNDDATHSHEFHQIEGLVVDKDISMNHLKGTLETLAKYMFGENKEIRFRPSYFPFTEPSFEVDLTCFKCEGKGCNICKGTGWIEVLGAGMVHPNVLKNCGYNPEEYTGFAFGVGVERIAMLKYEISDIRDFYTNNTKFLEQFNKFEGGENSESK